MTWISGYNSTQRIFTSQETNDTYYVGPESLVKLLLRIIIRHLIVESRIGESEYLQMFSTLTVYQVWYQAMVKLR